MLRLLLLLLILKTHIVSSQNWIISQSTTKSDNWIIVWGGKPSSSYGATWMKKEVYTYISCNNILWADYQLSRLQCDKILWGINPNFKVIEVYGFSRGGYNAFLEIGKVKQVWLIDPLIPEDYNIDFKDSYVFMIYNPGVWDSGNRSRLLSFSKRLSDRDCVKVDISHLKIPGYFFNTFR